MARISRKSGWYLIGGCAFGLAMAHLVATAIDSGSLGWADGAAAGLCLVGALLIVGFRSWFYLVVGLASAFAAATAAALTQAEPSDRSVAAMVATSITMAVGLSLDSIFLSLATVSQAEAQQWQANDSAVRRGHLQLVRASEALEVSRELHNRVANTLHAVTTRTASLNARMRERCRNDLDHLQDLRQARDPGTDSVSVAELVKRASAHASRIGVHLDVDVRNWDAPIPHATQVQATVVEALTNVAKHSSCQTAQLAVRVTDQTITTRVCDAGDGWPSDRPPGTGTRIAMAAALSDSPVVSISNLLTGGLAVAVVVDRPVPDQGQYPGNPPEAIAVHAEAAIPVARSLAFWLLGFCGVFTAVLWASFPAWWWLVMILLGTCMPMALINLAGARALERTEVGPHHIQRRCACSDADSLNQCRCRWALDDFCRSGRLRAGGDHRGLSRVACAVA